MLCQAPGEKLVRKSEYQRQLGEQIRFHGRDGLAKDADECQPKTLTVDQFIAARMHVSGYGKKEIEDATVIIVPVRLSPLKRVRLFI